MTPVNIEIRLYSILKQYARDNGMHDQIPITITAGTPLEQIMRDIGVPPNRVGRYLQKGRTLQADYTPAEGDVIDVLPPTISGG